MTKRIDVDLKVLRRCVPALLASSSPRMLRANMDYLWDRFVTHLRSEDLEKIVMRREATVAGRWGGTPGQA